MDKEKLNKLGIRCSSLGGAIIGALLGLWLFGVIEIFDGYWGTMIFWIAGIGLFVGGLVMSIVAYTQGDASQPTSTASAVRPVVDPADELKKYKDLLDTGAITQEEFDVKKKQLLNL